ncbi:hypothetical protein L208DRAFT_1299617, partial [Tricholoma matsutake]
LAYWHERVTRLSLKFNTLIDAHPTKYVDALLSTYCVSSSNSDIPHDAVVTLSGYQKSIQWYEDKILQLAGVGSEWREAHELYNRVLKVVHWTEEVSCLATVDPGGLVALHATKQLMFQVVETSSQYTHILGVKARYISTAIQTCLASMKEAAILCTTPIHPPQSFCSNLMVSRLNAD